MKTVIPRRNAAVSALACAALAIVVLLACAAGASAASQNVALVPSGDGDGTYGGSNGGTLPQTDFPNGYAPTFTQVTPETIRDAAGDPLAAYDTVALVQVCTIGEFLANAQFKARIDAFVQRGGKLLIWDSECSDPQPDYTNFFLPFKSDNPGASGASGTLVDDEDNSLSSTDPSSPTYINQANLARGEIGDANVLTSFGQRWCLDLSGTNTNDVTGPLHVYAEYGQGLVVFSGFDMDDLGDTFDPDGGASDQLDRLWYAELQQAVNPSGLPCSAKVIGITLTPEAATNPAGIPHTVTATVTNGDEPAGGVPVTFLVTDGPNGGLTATSMTGGPGPSLGQATFTYPSDGQPGTDTITATATFTRPNGTTSQVTASAQKTWVVGDQLGLPTVHGCVDTRKFSFKLHHGPHARVVTVDVYINGRKKLHKHARSIRKLTIKRLPKKRFEVQIIATQNTGSQLISVRTYKGCKKSRAHTRAHHHRRRR